MQHTNYDEFRSFRSSVLFQQMQTGRLPSSSKSCHGISTSPCPWQQCRLDQGSRKLYADDPDITIADVTFGKGAFWRKTLHLNVLGSDLLTVPDRPHDFRNLPYEDKSFDIVVLDPPNIHSPGNQMSDDRYQNAASTRGMLCSDIRQLFRDGIAEAGRVARRQVWVKCKDQVSAGQQCWLHVDVLRDAEELGMVGRDLFILDLTSRPPMVDGPSNTMPENQCHAFGFLKFSSLVRVLSAF